MTGSIVTERKHPRAKCEDCDLFSDGVFVPTKFPEGPATFAVVGEAPGLQEASRGEPFVGPSGQLLNRVLEYHGIERSEVILTNACLCRPPDNATPSKVAIECCRERLLNDVGSVQRVLALGNPASQSLLRTTRGITATRIGRAKQSPEGLTVVPSFHPAYCLRSGDQFPHLVNDTRKLVYDIPEWIPPKYVVADDEEFALAIIEELKAFDTHVIDIECGIDKDTDFDHPNRYQMLCIGVCYAKGKVVVFGERCFQFPSVIEALRNLFGNNRKLVCHNGKFDLAGLYPLLGDLPLWFDTMLASYSLNERPGNHKLEQLGQELLGMPDWKQEIQKYLGPGKNYASIPRPTLYKYNAFDVAGTWDLMEFFVAELERTGLRHLHDFLVEASNELKFLELNGITVDKVRNAELSELYLGILEGLEVQLDALCDKDYNKAGGINPRSPKQVKEYFHDHKIRIQSTDEDTLKQVARRIDSESTVGKFITRLLEHRGAVRRNGTYIKGIRNRLYRGRVYTTYSLHGSTSGRLTSRNPNLQNIVRDASIKSQFTVSHPDNIFVAVDYKQAEGRVICTLAQDENLATIFRDPTRDIFKELGKQLYGKTNLTKDERVRVKAYFYGLSYGREAFSIAQEYNLPVRETEIGLTKFFNLIPDVVKWQFRIKQMVLNGEDLVTSFGRRRRFWLITKENKKDVLNEALSYLPQSTASDICLRSLIRLRPMLRGLGFIRLTVHDALYIECKEERKELITEMACSVMVEEGAKWTDYVPFTVDVSYGKNWGELS